MMPGRLERLEPEEIKTIHSRFKEQMKTQLEGESRELNKLTERLGEEEKHERIMELIEKYPEKYPVTGFEKDLADFFQLPIPELMEVVNRLRNLHYQYFLGKLDEIKPDIPGEDINWIARLHLLGTLLKLMQDKRIGPESEGGKAGYWEEKVYPRLHMLFRGLGMSRIPKSAWGKVLNFLKERFALERDIEVNGKAPLVESGKGTDPYAAAHLTFQNAISFYFGYKKMLEEEDLSKAARNKTERLAKEALKQIKKARGTIREAVSKIYREEGIPANEVNNFMDLYALSATALFTRPRKWPVPPDQFEELVHELSSKSMAERRFEEILTPSPRKEKAGKEGEEEKQKRVEEFLKLIGEKNKE